MKTLTIPVKPEQFEQIEKGQLTEAFRLKTPHWQKELENADYDQVVIIQGSATEEKNSKRLLFPFNGTRLQTAVVEGLGPYPHEVYAIPLKNRQITLF